MLTVSRKRVTERCNGISLCSFLRNFHVKVYDPAKPSCFHENKILHKRDAEMFFRYLHDNKYVQTNTCFFL